MSGTVISVGLTALLIAALIVFPRVRRVVASDGVATLVQIWIIVLSAIHFDGDLWGVVLGATVVLLFIRLAAPSGMVQRLLVHGVNIHLNRKERRR